MENNCLLKRVHFVKLPNASKGIPDLIDLRIQDGAIVEVGAMLSEKLGESIVKGEEGQQFFISLPWMDLFSVVTDPGHEWKEKYSEWSKQAAAGGFGDCLVIPETNPAADKGEIIQSLQNRKNPFGVRMTVAAAVTAGKNGKQLAEMRDCFEAGSRIFSEGLNPSLTSQRMRIALEYAHGFGGKLLTFPQDADLAENGQIHEGKSSLATGLTGIPSLSESLMVYRDSELALMTGTEVHFCGISCAESVDIIRKAIEKGAPVSASVFASQLIYTEEDTESFESEFKVMPPYRSAKDREALRQAFAEGVIQGIASGHVPTTSEEKNLEFPYAAFGRRSFADCFQFAWEALVKSGKMTPAELVQRMVEYPRALTGIPIHAETMSFWVVNKEQSVKQVQLVRNLTPLLN